MTCAVLLGTCISLLSASEIKIAPADQLVSMQLRHTFAIYTLWAVCTYMLSIRVKAMKQTDSESAFCVDRAPSSSGRLRSYCVEHIAEAVGLTFALLLLLCNLYNVCPARPVHVSCCPQFKKFTFASWQQRLYCHKCFIWKTFGLPCTG